MSDNDFTARLLAAAGAAPPAAPRPPHTIDELIPSGFRHVEYGKRDATFDEDLPITPATDAMVLDQLVNEWLDLKAKIEKHTAMVKDVNEMILARLKPGQRHEVAPGVGVTIRAPSRSFDVEAASEMLAAADYAAWKDTIVTAPDPAKVKKALEQRHLLDQVMRPGTGKPSVVPL